MMPHKEQLHLFALAKEAGADGYKLWEYWGNLCDCWLPANLKDNPEILYDICDVRLKENPDKLWRKLEWGEGAIAGDYICRKSDKDWRRIAVSEGILHVTDGVFEFRSFRKPPPTSPDYDPSELCERLQGAYDKAKSTTALVKEFETNLQKR